MARSRWNEKTNAPDWDDLGLIVWPRWVWITTMLALATALTAYAYVY